MRSKRYALIAATPIVAVAILAWLVFRSWTLLICPEWRIEVVGKNGTPFGNIKVHQEWEYGCFTELNAEDKLTGSNGKVVFPSRSITEKGGKIILTRVLSFFFAHASFGSHAKISLPLNSFSNNDPRIFHGNNYWVTRVELPYNQSMKMEIGRASCRE